MFETHIDDEGIATLRMASPATANALTPQGFAELAAHLETLMAPSSGARVLVFTGSGGVFSAGAHLDALGTSDAAGLAQSITGALLPVQRLLAGSRLPTLAAVNGLAVGGAVGLALLFDIVLASRSARFSLVFAQLGLVPDTGLTRTLVQRVGEVRAQAWMMSAAAIGAEEAASTGMIYRAVDDASFAAETQALARRLAALPPASHRLVREAILAGHSNSLPQQIEYEAGVQAQCVLGEDFRAALAAFSARRKH